MKTTTTKLCSRPVRILDRAGRSTDLVTFADDGFRCPGHPDFDMRDHAMHRANAVRICAGAAWRMVRNKLDQYVPTDVSCVVAA